MIFVKLTDFYDATAQLYVNMSKISHITRLAEENCTAIMSSVDGEKTVVREAPHEILALTAMASAQFARDVSDCRSQFVG